jgi:D-alanine-D-alanine ligase
MRWADSNKAIPQHVESGVLILYNRPRDTSGDEKAAVWRESEEGVLGEVEAVAAALAELGIAARTVGIDRLEDLPAVLSSGPERIIFNLVEALGGDSRIANLVPAVCLPYGKMCTGGDSLCLAVTLDKWRTKAVLHAAGLPSAPGVIVPVGELPRGASLPSGPLIVKPVQSDASEGIDATSVIQRSGKALRDAVRRIHEQFGQSALIEQFVGERELNVSVLQRGDRVETMPIAEIEFHGFGDHRPRIVDYAAKWLPDSFAFQNTPRILPARLPARISDRLRRCALAAWDVLGCRDYVRVDFRLDREGRPFILEVNPNPDISPGDGFPAAVEAAGIPFVEFVAAIVSNAQGRLAQMAPAAPRPGRPFVRGRRRARIRRSRRRDRQGILDLLVRTQFFRPHEIEVAREVLDDALAGRDGGHYQSFVVDEASKAVGWVCFGPTPCTSGTFDVYWLAVAPERQSRGLGRALMEYAEQRMRRQHGRLVVVETSGQPRYLPTRRFYAKQGYREAACVRDFYAPGDDKLIYVKTV